MLVLECGKLFCKRCFLFFRLVPLLLLYFQQLLLALKRFVFFIQLAIGRKLIAELTKALRESGQRVVLLDLCSFQCSLRGFPCLFLIPLLIGQLVQIFLRMAIGFHRFLLLLQCLDRILRSADLVAQPIFELPVLVQELFKQLCQLGGRQPVGLCLLHLRVKIRIVRADHAFGILPDAASCLCHLPVERGDFVLQAGLQV